MKIKLSMCLAMLLLLGSCRAPYYVPPAKHINIDWHGSQIIITPFKGEKIRGEFIAIDKKMFIVLDDRTGRISSIPGNNIQKFKIRYAQPKQYGWAMPLFITSTLFHGGYLILTAPINAAVTAGVTTTGALDFTYNDKTIRGDEIQMFARFPQGIPEGIRLEDITRGGLEE